MPDIAAPASSRYCHDDDLHMLLRARLGRFEHTLRDATELKLKRAAVAVAVTRAEDSDGATFLLTKRTPKLRSHSSQWALPGGRVDEGETIEQTALRELEEELGITAGRETVIGRLDDYPTRSGYLISPVVLWIPGS